MNCSYLYILYILIKFIIIIYIAKSIELDERIPFISKLKRYSGLYNTTKEFTAAETDFVKSLKWNL